MVRPGKRLKNLVGIEVWPNVSTTRDDLSLRLNTNCRNAAYSKNIGRQYFLQFITYVAITVLMLNVVRVVMAMSIVLV